MGVTKVRGGQLKSSTVSSSEIKDNSLLEVDFAAGSVDGNILSPGTVTPLQVDLAAIAASLAGDGLVPNGTTIDLNIDESALSIIADQLQIDTTTVTSQGNVFNGADQLVQLLSDGKLPALDAGNLTGIPTGTGDLRADGTVPLTANWDVGSFSLTASAFIGDGSGLTNLPAVGGADFVDQEELTGLKNGVNTTFSLAFTPVAGSVHYWFGGILQREGVGNDYVISGTTITTAIAPPSGANLLASYRK